MKEARKRRGRVSRSAAGVALAALLIPLVGSAPALAAAPTDADLEVEAAIFSLDEERFPVAEDGSLLFGAAVQPMVRVTNASDEPISAITVNSPEAANLKQLYSGHRTSGRFVAVDGDDADPLEPGEARFYQLERPFLLNPADTDIEDLLVLTGSVQAFTADGSAITQAFTIEQLVADAPRSGETTLVNRRAYLVVEDNESQFSDGVITAGDVSRVVVEASNRTGQPISLNGRSAQIGTAAGLTFNPGVVQVRHGDLGALVSNVHLLADRDIVDGKVKAGVRMDYSPVGGAVVPGSALDTNNLQVDVAQPDPKIHVHVTHDDRDGNVVAGEEVVFTANVTNIGVGNLRDLEVTSSTGQRVDQVFVFDELGTLRGQYPSAKAASETSTGIKPFWTAAVVYEPHVVSATDIEAGSIENTVTAEMDFRYSTSPQTDSGTAQADGSVTLTTTDGVGIAPALRLDKSVTDTGGGENGEPNGVVELGEVLNYRFEVTNPGDTTIQNVAIADQMLTDAGVAITRHTVPPQDTDAVGLELKAGESAVFAARYVATQADVDAGIVSNIATATGTAKGGGEAIASAPDTANLTPSSGLGLALSGRIVDASRDGVVSMGEEVTYTFQVHNQGSVSVRDVVVHDEALADAGVAIAPRDVEGAVALAPGETAYFVATYVPWVEGSARPAELVASTAYATANRTGADPGSGVGAIRVESPKLEGVSIAVATPAVEVSTLTRSVAFRNADEPIEFVGTIRNTGDVALTELAVAGTEGLPAGFTGTLSPGEEIEVYVDHMPSDIAREGIARGSVDVTAAVAGSTQEVGASGVAQVLGAAVLKVRGSVQGELVAGQEVTYSVIVRNDGGAPLHAVALSTTVGGRAVTAELPDDTLAAGEEVTVQVPYRVTEADVAGSGVAFQSTATGAVPQVLIDAITALPEDQAAANGLVTSARGTSALTLTGDGVVCEGVVQTGCGEDWSGDSDGDGAGDGSGPGSSWGDTGAASGGDDLKVTGAPLVLLAVVGLAGMVLGGGYLARARRTQA